MASDDLDELDLGILHLLQENARETTPVDMAEQLPVSDQTIRNRIEKLEERGVIEGYVPVIDYEKAGFPIKIRFTCTAPMQERESLASEALQIHNIVGVEETLGSQDNVRPLAVTDNVAEISDIAKRLDDLGLRIESEQLVSVEHIRPFNHFGESAVSSSQ